MNDNSYLAFFEILGDAFKYKKWHDFDLHIALEVDKTSLLKYFCKGKSLGIETRGIADHGFIESIYFRDPNGYVIELTSPNNISNLTDEDLMKVLDIWNSQKMFKEIILILFIIIFSSSSFANNNSVWLEKNKKVWNIIN